MAFAQSIELKTIAICGHTAVAITIKPRRMHRRLTVVVLSVSVHVFVSVTMLAATYLVYIICPK